MVPDRRPFPLALYPSKCSPRSQPLRVTALQFPLAVGPPAASPTLPSDKLKAVPTQACELSSTSRHFSVSESVAVPPRFRCEAARYFLGLMIRQISIPEGLPQARAPSVFKNTLVCRRGGPCGLPWPRNPVSSANTGPLSRPAPRSPSRRVTEVTARQEAVEFLAAIR